MTTHPTPEALADITDRLRKDKWRITGVDAKEAAQTIEDLREQLAKAKADERHIYQSFSTCDDERRTLSAELAAARAEADTFRHAERELSAAYVRVRKAIGAMDPPSLSVLWAYVEDTASALKAERDSLRAEVERLRPKWLPIETAPKDGTLFLCWVAAVRYGETDEGQQYQEDVSQVDFCNWRTQADIPDCGWFDPCCGQIGDQQGVTHWMPLPPPPVAEGV